MIKYRHYLHVPSLNGQELESVKVASCSLENVDNLEYKVGMFEEGNGVVEFSDKEEINEEKSSVTVTNVVVVGASPSFYDICIL